MDTKSSDIEKSKEENKAPQTISILISFDPNTGSYNFSLPRDPLIALGMISMAQR